MGLKGVGSEIGRGIARYAEVEAKKQRAAYKRDEYIYRLSPQKKENIKRNMQFGDLFDEQDSHMSEIPKIYNLDLRPHR